ncbi:hypothetical protein POJ06DRAFT_52727 [Lipomyces tetrasporus]|uniref:Uncharacterized protein n=1 Tax=Lipomyces tetrasporus TaxID=54092 RepID=A0AAD7QZF3_9ASCO|nr:uncharacterized protein POJ06DRAFT_52727 [Lipomyces tetrasporus]KAJ8102632.1 hypothetical protein POJ06DRAFT_52727 [Lipomyces tetrasporus]
MSASLLFTRQRVIGVIASIRRLPVGNQFTVVEANSSKATLEPVEADESVPVTKHHKPSKKLIEYKRNVRRKKAIFIEQTSTFEGALERLKVKSEKPTITEENVRKLSQEELLAASVQKKQAGVRSAPNDAARRKLYTRLRPTIPSERLITLLVSRVETKEHATELKNQLKRLAAEDLYAMPTWQTTKLVRDLTLKGFYSEASDLVSHSEVYGLTFNHPVKTELLRAFSIRCEVFGWHLGHARKVRNMLVRLADFKDISRAFKVPQFTAVAISALTALRANDSSPPQEFLNSYKSELNSFVSALESRWHKFPKVLPSDEDLASIEYLSELQRRTIDFELSLMGLQRGLMDVSSQQQTFLNSAIVQIQESLDRANTILNEQAKLRNKKGFSNLTIDSYRQAFKTEKSTITGLENSQPGTDAPEVE